jgi:hypothetical protein
VSHGTHKNLLVVEGEDDKFAVAELMGAHINWPKDKAKAPVWIEVVGSADEILDVEYMTASLKQSGLVAMGVMLDADLKGAARYNRLRRICLGEFPGFPAQLPSTGLAVDNGQKRLGVWIMPDNSSEGYLETFLKNLIPDQSGALWNLAKESVGAARTMGATCRDSQVDRANLYTWLAWQDPPGQSPGRALTKKILDPHSASAAGFVDWFRTLYGL